MCETMESSHRLRPAMALVRALLAPTVSGGDDGEGDPQVEGTRKSRWSRVGTSKIIRYPILDFYPVICLVR
jgi:hypothetical protein